MGFPLPLMLISGVTMEGWQTGLHRHFQAVQLRVVVKLRFRNDGIPMLARSVMEAPAR